MTAVVLCGPVGPSTLNPTLIRTQTQPLAISAQLLQPQDLMQSLIGTQLNNRLFGQLVPEAQRHFLCIGVVGSWRRTSGQMLNESFPHGAASLNLGFQTFLPKGLDYLIHKRLILTSSGPERNVPNYNLTPTSQ
ncbi:hypothetical protein DPMN_033490 [Dreissena polymorpha]|uniref:Uncharacterized protein n=1 Tax=Dreissena polymorpha TaxID=45954 RepID=A0A9D4M4X9_DREPO|nr:hypothetical protein DPMN_033490 [Dreissena polymorpha]